MKISELKNLTLAELQNNEADFYRQYFELQCKKTTNQLSKPHMLRQMKKNIARVKTALRMKRSEGQK